MINYISRFMQIRYGGMVLDRNDRNTIDNARRGQGQPQTFRRSPQRPPAPDYGRQQRENAAFERRSERRSGPDDGSRMNPRTPQEQRFRDRGFDLPGPYAQFLRNDHKYIHML